MILPRDIKNGMQIYCMDGNIVGTVESCESDGQSIKLRRDDEGASNWIKMSAVKSVDEEGLHLNTNAVDAKKAFVTKAPRPAVPVL